MGGRMRGKGEGGSGADLVLPLEELGWAAGG